MIQRVLLISAIAVAALLSACGEEESSEPQSSGDQVAGHIHGLGINPADGALFIATHNGLFRSAEGAGSAERVGESQQDTMGFTVVGSDHFYGSGHPGPGEEGPPHLGLIESTDAGKSWRSVSLAGEADFHVLRFAHAQIYAYNGLSGEIMVSEDGGESWTERRAPAPVIDLAISPDDPERILAATERGLEITNDGGRRWNPLAAELGLLAWPSRESLYLIDGQGRVRVSRDSGQSWEKSDSIGGQPASLIATAERELYAALADGSVLHSRDGGASWDLRVRL